CADASSCSDSSSENPMMVCSGVRSSWLRLARNSLFSRLARSTSRLRSSSCWLVAESSQVKVSFRSWMRWSACVRLTDVADNGAHPEAVLRLHWAQADLHGEADAVFPCAYKSRPLPIGRVVGCD